MDRSLHFVLQCGYRRRLCVYERRDRVSNIFFWRKSFLCGKIRKKNHKEKNSCGEGGLESIFVLAMVFSVFLFRIFLLLLTKWALLLLSVFLFPFFPSKTSVHIAYFLVHSRASSVYLSYLKKQINEAFKNTGKRGTSFLPCLSWISWQSLGPEDRLGWDHKEGSRWTTAPG